MGRADYYLPGAWDAYCSMCGRKMKSSMLVKNWQGMYRCPEHNEPRQPQDFVHGVEDKMTVPWAQTLGVSSKDILMCTPSGMTARSGIAMSGCAVASRVIPGN